mgnify:CR=1 FL=1
MKQIHKNYSVEDFQVWKALFNRQKGNLKGKACADYLFHLDEMAPVLNENKVPDFRELNEMLLDKTGWSIEVVPGLIPVDDFFELLAKRKFCSSTWLRKMHQLDYLEEPDMFHDIFGHIPLLMNPEYAQFIEDIGQLGLRHKNDRSILDRLEKLYWFTIEFGLMQAQDGLQIYGAGIISSYGETNHIYTEGVKISGFDLEHILNAHFTTSEVQNQYCSIDSFAQLYSSIKSLESRWAPAARKRA